MSLGPLALLLVCHDVLSLIKFQSFDICGKKKKKKKKKKKEASDCIPNTPTRFRKHSDLILSQFRTSRHSDLISVVSCFTKCSGTFTKHFPRVENGSESFSISHNFSLNQSRIETERHSVCIRSSNSAMCDR